MAKPSITLPYGAAPEEHRREWRVQRGIWVGLLLGLSLAAAGLLSHGPLTRERVEGSAAGTTLQVEHEAWTRYHHPFPLEVALQVPADTEEVSLLLDKDYLAQVDVEGIIPEPNGTALHPEGGLYMWEVRQGGALAVVFELQADGFGLYDGRLRAYVDGAEGPEVRFVQRVFP